VDFSLPEEQKKRREEFFQVCKELEKNKPAEFMGVESIFHCESTWDYYMHCRREFAKRKWTTLNWPAEYGGHGDMMDRVFLAEAMGYHEVPGLDGWGIQMLAPTLLAVASDDVKKRFLPPIARAEVQWCEMWSEPNAGSDLASLTTTAIRKGDEFVINGQKIWTSGAHRSDWAFGVFKSDLEAKKHHNLTFLLLDMKTPGITIRPIPYMNGIHVYNEVFLDDVRVPAENIVGQEHGGWAVVNTLAAFERSFIEIVMMMKRMFEDLVVYCSQTRRNGQLLSSTPVIRNRLSQLACELEAARMLSYRIADLQGRNEMALIQPAGLKVFASDLGERMALIATDLLGPFGQVKTSRWAPLGGFWENQCQECFGPSIAAGSTEIQKNIIAWYGLGLPRMK
jgi:alkylation response protein AidB-like acyl-CoA dehydrogenase